MTFSGGFGRVFRPVFDPGLTALPWYRAGGAPLPVAAYQPKGAASLAASYINLANPGTYNAAPGVAPTWASATGWTFDNSSTYLSTGWTPATGQNQSMIVRFSGYTTIQDDTLCGVFVDIGGIRTFALARLGMTAIYRNGGQQNATVSGTSGVMAVAGSKGYHNGAEIVTGISSSALAYIGPVYIGCTNYNSGSRGNYFGGAIQALAIYNTTLTAPQVAAVSAAMAAL